MDISVESSSRRAIRVLGTVLVSGALFMGASAGVAGVAFAQPGGGGGGGNGGSGGGQGGPGGGGPGGSEGPSRPGGPGQPGGPVGPVVIVDNDDCSGSQLLPGTNCDTGPEGNASQ